MVLLQEDRDIALTGRHYKSVSMDSCFIGKMSLGDESSLKLPPSPTNVSPTNSGEGNSSGYSVEFGNSEFTAAEMKKITADEKLADIVMSDPKRVKRNGDTYAGEYFADRMHGFGVYQFGNGHRYEGAWHEGRRQGLGMYTFRNGETQACHCEDSVLSCPTEQTTRPDSLFSISHSKVLDTFQQARKAAEKAREVVKVEERVNRAVMVPNRAANAARVAATKAVQPKHFTVMVAMIRCEFLR